MQFAYQKNITMATNFHFEITVPDGAAITLININGTEIKAGELGELGQQAENNVIKGDKLVLVPLGTILFIIEAVGEPNLEISATLKFFDKPVTLDPDKFHIGNNRRGLLALTDVTLP